MTHGKSAKAAALPFLFCAAGAAFGFFDVIRAVGATVSPITVGGLWLLDVLTGVLLGVLFAVFLWLGDWIYPRFGRRVPRGAIDGLLLTAPAAWLGLALFSGKGVTRTPLGQYGPSLLPIGSIFVVWLASTTLRGVLAKTDQASPGRRALLTIPVILAAVLALWTDRSYYQGLYIYLHVLLALGALSLLGLSFRILRLTLRSNYLSRSLPAAIVLLSLPMLFYFPVPDSERVIIVERSLLSSRTAETLWYLVDMDSDGFSPLLGGGDCDDTNPSISPIGLDITKNGIDEDCDGADPTAFYKIRTASYKTDPAMAKRIVAAAGKHPTLVILVDALRGDRLSNPRFPNLFRLAGESLHFEHAYAPAAKTTLSVPTILIGRSVYSPSEPNIAERMAAAGKRTALVTTEHVATFLRYYGGTGFALERGFDTAAIVPRRKLRPGQKWDGLGGHIDYWTATQVTRRLLALLDRPEPPDFTWVHYFDLHQYHVLKLAYLKGKSREERYDAVLEMLDKEIGHILKRANRLNIVLIADHGEGFGKGGVSFHGGYLHHDLVHVPLLIRVPGIRPTHISAPVALTDLAPTLSHLMGLSDDAAWRSRSLLGLAGVADPGTGPPILMFEGAEWSIVEGKWRLVLSLRSGVRRLYDTDSDPLEENNLAADEPETTERLARLLLQLAALAHADHPSYAPISEMPSQLPLPP